MTDYIEVKKENVELLADLASEIWHEYWVGILSPEKIEYMLEKFQSKTAMLLQMEKENYHYFFINNGQENVGYIGLSLKKDYLFLSKLYIKKDFRHCKIGTQSFEFIKKYASNIGYKKIILTVNKHNKNTINAYLKWGFQNIDSVETDIGKGFIMDDYIMEYKLG